MMLHLARATIYSHISHLSLTLLYRKKYSNEPPFMYFLWTDKVQSLALKMR